MVAYLCHMKLINPFIITGYYVAEVQADQIHFCRKQQTNDGETIQ